jgi:hypothetical protein
MNCKAIISLYLLGTLCVAGCGGGGGGNSSTPPTITSVSASCSPTSIYAGQTTQTSQCSAIVSGTGSYSSAVTWSASSGTISTTGVYTAPATVPTSGTATITATSTEDATKSGPASITVTPAVSVSVSCLPTSVAEGDPSTCSATLTKTTNTAVTWSASAGTISSGGVLSTTGVTPGTQITVTATSVADIGAYGSATVNVTAPTITSVSASCLPATLQAHTTATSQCSATVQGTGSYSSAVTWSATYGAITTAGVYTAPLTAPASGTDTVTATSTQDGTKYDTASITITAARVITLTLLYPTVSQAETAGIFPVVVNETGLQAGDVIQTTEMGTPGTYTISQTDFTNGYFVVDIGISEVPSFVQFTCGSPTSANAVCNTAWVAVTTDQQQLVENTSSTTAYFNPGYTFGVQEFLLSSGANEGTLSLVGPVVNQNTAISVDGGSGGTGALVSDVEFEAVDSTTGTPTSGIIAPSGTPATVLASIAARNGYGYVTEPSAGYLGQFTISTTSGLGAVSTVGAGVGPYAIDAATVNSADAIVVYSGQDKMVRLFSNTPALESSSAALSNITPFLTVQSANAAATPEPAAKGGWPLRILGGSGIAAGTVGVLSSYDNVLDFLTISSGNALSWPTSAYATVAGNPYLIAPDATHGAFIVALADTTNGVTTLQSISTTSPYAATTITPNPALPAGFLASGILVSDDGSTIYVAGFNCTDATKTPMFHTIANP